MIIKETLNQKQKTAWNVICHLRDEIVGGYENLKIDDKLNYIPTQKHIENEIYKRLLNGGQTHKGLYYEPKHIKFCGTNWLKQLIHERCEYDKIKNGWNFL